MYFNILFVKCMPLILGVNDLIEHYMLQFINTHVFFEAGRIVKSLLLPLIVWKNQVEYVWLKQSSPNITWTIIQVNTIYLKMIPGNLPIKSLIISEK